MTDRAELDYFNEEPDADNTLTFFQSALSRFDRDPHMTERDTTPAPHQGVQPERAAHRKVIKLELAKVIFDNPVAYLNTLEKDHRRRRIFDFQAEKRKRRLKPAK